MFQFEKKLLLLTQTSLKHGKHIRGYSKKSGSKNLGSFKIVNSKDVVEDPSDSRFDTSPNWELFGSRGHRFMLPGSIGPAWHETGSMVPIDGFNKSYSKPPQIDFETLECTAQDCPVLLKDSIRELFPGYSSTGTSQVTVVTLARRRIGGGKLNSDSEYHAKTFMWAAQEICLRLKMAGYWADFINPFSGRPYLSTLYKSSLYEADERFRCIGFEISKKGNCKIIETKRGKQFVGSLFTNAPPSTDFLLDLLRD